MHVKIPVTEIMVEDVLTGAPETTASEAATAMREREVSSIVVSENGSPVGILTEGDFARHLCHAHDLGRHTIGDVMSAPLTAIGPDATILDAAKQLREHGIDHLPIVDGDRGEGGDGTLVGIVTASDLSYFIPQLLHPPIELGEVPPKRSVRTDTQYERENWSFGYHGADDTQVSVGDVAEFSKRLSEEDVEAFAEVSGDTNRLHLEESYARRTRFGTRIVHGVLAVGLISAALARLPGLTIYLSQEISFQGPIEVDERATARCEIIDNLGGSRFRVATTVTDSDDETVLDGEAVVLVDELPSELDEEAPT